MYLDAAAVAYETELANAIYKRLTLDRVVPIVSAGFAELRHQQENARRHLSLELKRRSTR